VSDLGEVYASLPPPCRSAPSARVFSVRPIEKLLGYFVGRAENDNPALLIEIDGKARAPIILQNTLSPLTQPAP
jgi:hypothetical protein